MNSENIRKLPIPEDALQLIEQFADLNGFSRSEAVRDAMEAFVTGDYAERQPAVRMVSTWVSPEQYAAFAKRARELNMTIARAMSLAIQERVRP